MKRMKITIDQKGNVETDLLEGFAGQSCTQATKFIEVAVGAGDIQQKEKDEYYQDEDYNMNEIFNNR